jgi:hypothetical protein
MSEMKQQLDDTNAKLIEMKVKYQVMLYRQLPDISYPAILLALY